jgi:hypothetical protein
VDTIAQQSQGPVRLPPSRLASPSSRRTRALQRLALASLLATLTPSAHAQTAPASLSAREARIRDFLAQRSTSDHTSPALARLRTEAQHAALLTRGQLRAHATTPTGLNAAWQPLGPGAIVSSLYGDLTGRVTAIALDPNDATGNTVYLGTTGGGVWKSTNAAGTLTSVTFSPLTDTIFSTNAGSSTIPSLSIGAVAVQPAPNPVILAGTGDPNDATDSLYGEGILRSTDNGLTWTLITQTPVGGTNATYSFAGLATAAIAWSTSTPTLVVAALSLSPQSAIVDAMNPTSIPGLYYSTDAGQTWQMSTLYDGSQIVQQPVPVGRTGVGNPATSVVWDAQRALFIAAVRGHGYYSSPDGANWTRLANQPGTGLTTANCPANSNQPASANCPIFRGALAVQPATGDLYALTVDSNDNDQGLWQDLCNANSSGVCSAPAPTWAARIDNGALEVGSGNTSITQGNYDLSLAASPAPSNGTLLFAATVDLFRCSLTAGSSSCTFRDTTNSLNGCDAPAGVAPSQHALVAVQTGETQLVLLGNDGGLWRSTDGVAQTGAPCSSTDAQHFDNLNTAIGNTGSLVEITGFAQDPSSPNTLLVGLGEDGSAGTGAALNSTGSLTAWPQLAQGEGGYPHIDPDTPANWFLSIGAEVNLDECPLGSSCSAQDFLPPATLGEPQVENDAALLDPPTLLDPQLTTNVLIGTCRVWRGPTGSNPSWTTVDAISPAFDGSACNNSSSLIRSLAAAGPATGASAPQDQGSSVLYAGMAGNLDGGGSIPGHLFVTTSSAGNGASTATWTDTALSPVTNDQADANVFNPAGFDISSVTTDSHDVTGATVYATVMGFGNVPHLYRSTDFGAHWVNISSNLPSAPANAVVIDPNDANTVYVALDTGVYVTQSITTCSTVNCWSVLGTALPNAPVTTLEAAANLPTGDGRLGLLRAGTYGRGLWQIPLLTAHSANAPAITLSATTLTFGATAVATQSSAQTITVTSSGNSPVTFSTPAITGDFVETDTCTGQTLAVGATCSFAVSFAPTQTGARSGLLTIYANIPGGQATVSLNGAGTAAAAIVLTPLTLTFPATIVNQTATAQIITVANTGQNPATLDTPAITGDFTIAQSTCTSTLAAQTACSLSISFTPTASGTRSGVLTLTDSAGTQTAQLTGTGNAPATDTLSPPALTFAQQTIGTSSAAQQVILTNNGDVALTLIAASVSPGDFTAVNNCGPSLNPHSTCAISITFVPSAVGARTATLTVTDQFRYQTVLLTGIGIAPPSVSLSPSSLSFPATGVGLTAPPQTLTLTNNGGLPLNVAGTSISPGFLIASSTCTTTLAPNSNCTLTIVFAPTTPGPVAGTLTLTDNATSGTQTTNLTGTGVDFTLSTNGATTVSISSGSTATYPLLLTSLSSLTGTVALSCAGAPANSVCTVSPSTPGLGSTALLTATVQTGMSPQTTAEQSQPTPPHRQRDAALLALLALPLVVTARKRRALRVLLPLVLLGVLTTLTGCGSDRVIPLSTTTTGDSNPTPSGTSTITVSATAAGVTHSVKLTLTVQ